MVCGWLRPDAQGVMLEAVEDGARRSAPGVAPPAVAVASLYEGEDNLGVVLAEVWDGQGVGPIPDATTAAILRALDCDQVLAVAAAFCTVTKVASGDRHNGIRLYFETHPCLSAHEITAVNALLASDDWRDLLPAIAYITENAQDWLRLHRHRRR
ncbi:Uncharacterized protein PBTT_04027 [Plasmodiophora brassicae]